MKTNQSENNSIDKDKILNNLDYDPFGDFQEDQEDNEDIGTDLDQNADVPLCAEDPDISEFNSIGMTSYQNDSKEDAVSDSESPCSEDIAPKQENPDMSENEEAGNEESEQTIYRESTSSNISDTTPLEYYQSMYEDAANDQDVYTQDINEAWGTPSQIHTRGAVPPEIPDSIVSKMKSYKKIEEGKNIPEEKTSSQTENLSQKENPHVKDAFLKIQKNRTFKICAVLGIVLLIVGIIRLIQWNGNKGRDTDNNMNSLWFESASSTRENEDTTSKEPYTKEITESENVTDELTEFSSEDIPAGMGESTRFSTLDDLTFYLDSQISSIMANEKMLANQYLSGSITQEEYISSLQDYSKQVDSHNHLLVANRNLYKEEGKEDDYNVLTDNINTLTTYGDSLIYEAQNSKSN